MDGEIQPFELRAGQRVSLGSGPAADIRLRDRTVSGTHCDLVADDLGVEVVDLGSKNGVFVGGARVSRARLEPTTSSFVIGRSTVTVRALASMLFSTSSAIAFSGLL